MNPLRGLGALTRAYLLDTRRTKAAIFWNLAFPILFVVALPYIFGGGAPEHVVYIVPGVMTINLIAASFFGVSLQMVSLRESQIYRRFRVTPVTSLTVILAHAATALVNILVSMALQLVVAMLLFGMRIRGSLPDLTAVCLLAAFAFIPLGLIVGSVARDMKTAPAIGNLLFFPMMFLSGAAMPLFLMPEWLKRIAALLPATYVVELLQGVVSRGDRLSSYALPLGVLALTGIVGFACNALLFRWEVGEPLSKRGLALTAAMLGAVYLTVFAIDPELRSASAPPDQAVEVPEGALVFTGATVLDGLGNRIERARLIVHEDRILEVTSDGSGRRGEDARSLSGTFVIPGLIESHCHIGGSAGGAASLGEFLPSRIIRDLQVYLAHGVTSFVSMTDDIDDMASLRAAVANNEMRAPRPFYSGPSITAPGGHPATIFQYVPGLAERMTLQLESEEEAIAAVGTLERKSVDLVKLFLEGGWPGNQLPILAGPAFRAAVTAAREAGLTTTVHVDSDRSVRLALDAGVDGIEHAPPDLSAESMARMVADGVTLTPALAALEGLSRSINEEPMIDPLVQEWVDPNILDSLQSSQSWLAGVRESSDARRYYEERYEQGLVVVRRAVELGVRIVAGSDAGNPATFHGPGLIRELTLLVECGMAPADALVAATGNAAARLGTTEIGRIAPGSYADFVVLGSDPTVSIDALRDVREVYFRGVAIDRDTLLASAPGNWMPGRPRGF